MSAQQDKGGRTLASSTVTRQIARVFNPRAQQLAESILAKALQGDSTAQLAAVQLLALASQPRSKQPGTPAKGGNESVPP